MSVLLLGGSPATNSGSARLMQHVGHRLARARPPHHASCLCATCRPGRCCTRIHRNEVIRCALALVEDADAVVVATPVYKASYTGILKAFLDLLPQDGLAGKLVLPLATGGSQSHMLALDYALRPVLAALSARFILPSIYATSDQLEWIEDSGLLLAAPIAARIAHGVDQLSSELNALPRHQLDAGDGASPHPHRRNHSNRKPHDFAPRDSPRAPPLAVHAVRHGAGRRPAAGRPWPGRPANCASATRNTAR